MALAEKLQKKKQEEQAARKAEMEKELVKCLRVK